MNLNMDYEFAIDFEHCIDLHDAGSKLSLLTNILNKIIMVRQYAKKEILKACISYTTKEEPFHKWSWENKLVRLGSFLGYADMIDLWMDAESAYKQVKNKQDQVFEDINCLKRIDDVTPR